MTVEVNKEKLVSNETELQALLEEIDISQKGIAVAVNGEVIMRAAWKETQIQENDKITIIKATQGG